MRLCPSYHEEIEIALQSDIKSDYLDIPTGKEVVYSDNSYRFILSGSTALPSKIFINDEAYNIELCEKKSETVTFKLLDCEKRDKPFLHSFGAIKIEIVLDGRQYFSKSIAVMVSNTDINNGVLNMIEFIYNHCEDYLYEEHKHSSIASGVKKNEIISLEAKIAFLQQTLKVYKQSYQYLKTNPYSKLEKTERVDSIDKLQSVSPRAMQYVINNIDELTVVNYDTGIRFNNQYYQPNRILIESNSYSYDVYENQIIIGFLKTLVSDISSTIKSLSEKIYFKNKTSTTNGYIDSMYYVFSRSIKKSMVTLKS